ncbi:hypothetical protein L198_05799 [Cryptococcus wingfieldii CBS 7118]|uniref:JmjC domain-containing protein n=1 Tax=Cryptococcus wingfieldii CBS 7118 TaxID=1295528 RepID=A0A1E3IU58_9TREE|nr:hypothetical protein L198_05799 [Cryptococcus wingfieldii CBS 7118]ODN92127.1 hypothetical protein L198_05799 [Cryptococcus wingfieldii CBS 7118]
MPSLGPTIEQRAHIDRLVSSIPDRTLPTYQHPTHDQLLRDHLIPNTPFLLTSSNTSQWPAAKALRTPGAKTGKASDPDLRGLRQYAHHVVPVANTLKPQFSEFERTERPLGEVLDLWETDINAARGLYVKDWHLMAEIESEGRGVGEVYTVPECLRDDWLNPPYTPSPRATHSESVSTSTSDFRFTYAGPALTYTPLHRDVYGSYSWSANVVGRKVWWLFPPDRLDKIKDQNGELYFDVRDLEDEGEAIKVLQQEGEIIFVPSGWHHQVLNIDFCISINHNFFSSPTLPRIYATLCLGQNRVEESILDVKEMIIDRLGTKDGSWEKEWFDEVQSLLEMDAGWNWKGFWATVKKNLEMSPSLEHDLPPALLQYDWVREVIAKYKERREWLVLDAVKNIVLDIERLLA